MPAYQYKTKNGMMWRVNINYTQDGEHKQICKRGFTSKEDAELYEEAFLLQHPYKQPKPMSELLKEMLGVPKTPEPTLPSPENVYTPSDILNNQALNCTGIYVVHNLSKEMYYVGQAKSTLRRLKQHFTGVGGNGDVYADYKYGDAFEIFIFPFDITQWTTLDMQEKYFIEKYQANINGYNKTRGNT